MNNSQSELSGNPRVNLMTILLLSFNCLFCLASDSFTDDLISDLSAQYKSGNQTERIEAVLEIGQRIPKLNDEQQLDLAYRTLIDAVADPAELVTAAARLRLAELGTQAVPYLKPFLESEKFIQFAKACESIKAIGPTANKCIPLLEKHVDSNDPKFQLAALHGLGVFEGEELLPVLDKTIAALDSDNFNIQLSACRVISRIGPSASKAGPRLVKLLEEGIASSRSWASIALGAIGPNDNYDVVALLEERLDRFYLVDRQRALIGLAHLGSQAKHALPKIEALMKEPSKSVQHTAARAHWKISGESEPAIECLIKLVPTMDFGADAMDILGEMKAEAKSAVSALIGQLKSPEAPTREAAIYALASIGPSAAIAIEPLRKIEADEDQLIREAARMAIKKIQQSEPTSSNQ